MLENKKKPKAFVCACSLEGERAKRPHAILGAQVKSMEKLSMEKFSIGVDVVVVLSSLKGLSSQTSAEGLAKLKDGV